MISLDSFLDTKQYRHPGTPRFQQDLPSDILSVLDERREIGSTIISRWLLEVVYPELGISPGTTSVDSMKTRVLRYRRYMDRQREKDAVCKT